MPLPHIAMTRALDSSIRRMKPDEQGKYLVNLFNHLYDEETMGKISDSDVSREIDKFYDLYISRMSISGYVNFLQAKSQTIETNLIRMMAERDLKILDLKQTFLELMIDRIASSDRILTLMLFRDLPEEEAAQKTVEYILQTREEIKPIVEQLNKLRTEYSEFVTHDVWEKLGGIPPHTGHECTLSEDLLAVYDIELVGV